MKKNEEIELNSSVMVDGIEIPTHKEEITSCNIIEVEVGTTGHMGGDTGHGGRTYFKIKNLSSTDMRPRAHSDNFGHNWVEIVLGGDTELDTFCEALRVGYEVLSRKAGSVDYYMPTPFEQRQERFALYINELCEHYRQTGSLKGMGDIRTKHHITGLTQQQFFECDLHRAEGYVSQDFCNRVYDFVLDTTKAVPAPKYDE
jgi:hypothetical protein